MTIASIIYIIGFAIFFLCMIAMIVVPSTRKGLDFVNEVVLPILFGTAFVVVATPIFGLTVCLIKSLLN